MRSNLIVYDVGSTYTKVSAFCLTETALEWVAGDRVPTTVEDIEQGLTAALQRLEAQGIQIDDSRTCLAASSAAGGLRMVAMGYMPRVTAKAAKEVAMNAGARVLEIITHEDPPDYRLEILREIRPDIILLAGGTDGGDQANIFENADLILKSGIPAVVIIAGNQQAQPGVEKLFQDHGVTSRRVGNVMPTIHELKVGPAREAIHEEFIRQISMAKGLHKLIGMVSNHKVAPTPGAVLLAAELIARGTHRQKGIGDLLVIDLGGATTDIHSILPKLDRLSIEEKGLVITNEKQPSYRTVEGVLGLRVSATGILDTVGSQAVLAKLEFEAPGLEEKLIDYAGFVETHPDHIALNPEEEAFDRAMAAVAVEVALKRHAGYLAQEYNPVMGIIPGTAIGRDLRNVKNVIAVGGVFVHHPDHRHDILSKAFASPGISLLPKAPRFLFDDKYLLYALGVLSQITPDKALNFAKKYFQWEDSR
ncbi:MAG: glutamate mutase L [Deltaproteobacteria bacterium]|nr:glutamate mutase L [Deltaproteobacteria bacterium]